MAKLFNIFGKYRSKLQRRSGFFYEKERLEFLETFDKQRLSDRTIV